MVARGPRYEARKKFQTFYETGRPCKHGHVAKRYVSTGHCCECLLLGTEKAKEAGYPSQRAWSARNPDRVREKNRRYRKAKREEPPAIPTTAREARSQNATFYQGNSCKWGHSGVRYASSYGCVECHTARWTEAAARYRARIRAANPLKPFVYPDAAQAVGARLQTNLKARVKRDGLPIDPEFYLQNKLVGDWIRRQPNCACCGVEFDLSQSGGRGKPNVPSIDQLVPGLGYTIKNTRLICLRCNVLKSNATAAELRRIADWIDKELAL